MRDLTSSFKHTHSLSSFIPPSLLLLPQIEPALHALATLLFVNNQEVLRHVLIALALVLPGLAPDLTVARRLVELLGADDADVQLMTIGAITDLVRFDQHHTQARHLLLRNRLQFFLHSLVVSHNTK